MTRVPHILLALLLLAVLPSYGGDFESEDFALRFSAALSRLSTYPDVAGQAGASVASARSTSINPAALAWRPLYTWNGADTYRFAVSGQFTGISFDRGTDLWATTQSLSFYPTAHLALKLSATQLRSDGGIFEVDANAYRFDLARRFDGRVHPFSLGLQFSYSQTETNVSLPAGNYPVPTPRGPVSLPFRKQVLGDSDRESFGVRFGWQMSLRGPETHATATGEGKATLAAELLPSQQYDIWLLGLSVDYAYQPTKRGKYSAHPAVVEGASGKFVPRDYQQLFVRAGTAWRYTPLAWAEKKRAGYLRGDYQWGWLSSGTSELQVHRLYLGGSYPLHAMLDLNAGAVVDDRRHVAWSAGFSFKIPNLAIEAAYQYDILPEISSDFGHSETIVVSMGFAF